MHLLAERSVRELQQAVAVGGSNRLPDPEVRDPDGIPDGAALRSFPACRILDSLAGVPLQLDVAEHEKGDTALHIASFGGQIGLAQQMVALGASVGLPNKDGFTPLDSMQPSGAPGKSLQELLLNKISKPSSWTPDRIVTACQQCKLPFNRANPDMARKHHCRHCGRCVCAQCSPRRIVIAKFGEAKEERVCLLCERTLAKSTDLENAPAP
uniref:FYVE-type domain-containing protein n=1 Tax=Haptolina ericina TaxID=156174 RepID=A0A7S3AGC6_9EUKA